jgi:hypothetical protein
LLVAGGRFYTYTDDSCDSVHNLNTSINTSIITLSWCPEVRQEHDTSKCETFDPAKLSAVSKEVMDKRHRTILLDAGEGNQMEVGTALRNQRMQKENSSMETKLKSRLARWRAVSKVTSAVATPLSTTGYITQGNVFIVSVKISEAPTVAVALVHTVNKKQSGKMWPFNRLQIGEVETVGLQILQPAAKNPLVWQHHEYFLCRQPQRLLYQLHPPAYIATKDQQTSMVTINLTENADGILH